MLLQTNQIDAWTLFLWMSWCRWMVATCYACSPATDASHLLRMTAYCRVDARDLVLWMHERRAKEPSPATEGAACCRSRVKQPLKDPVREEKTSDANWFPGDMGPLKFGEWDLDFLPSLLEGLRFWGGILFYRVAKWRTWEGGQRGVNRSQSKFSSRTWPIY
jgi:hypothetical protein